MKNRILKILKTCAAAALSGVMALSVCGCGRSADTSREVELDNSDAAEIEASGTDSQANAAEIQVFIAASLSNAMNEIAQNYNGLHPEIKVTFNADSSGTLMTQIKEGAACDIFFSASDKQMDELEQEGLVDSASREELLGNQVCVITYKGSETEVTGLDDIEKAESIALADGSVPVGRYTRQALYNSGKLIDDSKTKPDVSKITTARISEALGGVEISEQGNVSKVLLAVKEHSCEVGTVYYSDIYKSEEEIEILEMVDPKLTGDINYPVAAIINDEADEAEKKASTDFLEYIKSEEAKAVFERYNFAVR